MENGFKIIGGSSNIPLVDDITRYILHEYNYVCKPTDVLLDQFSDGESRVQINENLRGYHVFVVQSLSYPINDHLMELCLILDTLKRCNVFQVTVVVSYYGYARQDRKDAPRTPISAKVVADMIQSCGLDRLVAVDLHSPQIQGFFNCPVDNLYASKVLLKHIDEKSDPVIVSPDRGGVERAVYYAKRLNCPVSFCYKHRDNPNEISEMKLIGDVKGRNCILLDDMADTSGTLVKASQILKENGAKNIEAMVTHGVFSGDAVDKLTNSPISRINVTNTINLPRNILTNNKFNVINVDEMIAEAIVKIYRKESISSLFV